MKPSKRLNALTIAFNHTMKTVGEKAWKATHFGWQIGPSFFLTALLTFAPAHPVYYEAHLEHNHSVPMQKVQKHDLSWKEEEQHSHTPKSVKLIT